MTISEIVKNKLKQLERRCVIDEQTFAEAKLLYIDGLCQMVSRTKLQFSFQISYQTRILNFTIIVNTETNEVFATQNNVDYSWDKFVVACLYQLIDYVKSENEFFEGNGIKYTREGMIARVIDERRQRALTANYSVELANNIYGEHILTNEKGKRYKITLRDFEHQTGYIDSIDLRTNKLGITKHILWLFEKLKNEPELLDGLDNQYPFIEIFLEPLNEYKITWFYPHPMPKDEKILLEEYFGNSDVFPDERLTQFLKFIEKAEQYPMIKIRPDVLEKVDIAFEVQMLNELREKTVLDFSKLKKQPYPYQIEGIEFATFRRGAIIADEIGLGKTLQAIVTAIFKRDLLGFRKTLVVCPNSYLNNWKLEIESSTDSTCEIINRQDLMHVATYFDENIFFVIADYETIVADFQNIADFEFDFIVIDETQKLKNYQSKTSMTIKKLKHKHLLALTDSPIEDKLVDLYSVVEFVDQYFLSPLWEFSYQHCLFDAKEKDKIVGYYNLSQLKNRIQAIMIRRSKQEVFKQLPNIREINVPIKMHPVQLQYYNRYAYNLRQLLQKKIFTQFDIRKIMLQLNYLRMVCDSTNLVDTESNISPKIVELKNILTEKISIAKHTRIVIYSEWQKMIKSIAEMLKQNDIAYIEINNNQSNETQRRYLKRFLSGDCNVLISTDLKSNGISEQAVDFIINVEIPWNLEQRNARIGEINRLVNGNNSCSIINLVNIQTIETSIMMGKFQNHEDFSEIFNIDSRVDFIDVENPGISQIVKELYSAISATSVSFDEMAFASIDGIESIDCKSNNNNCQSVDIQQIISLFDNALNGFYDSYKNIMGREFEYVQHSIDYDDKENKFVIKIGRK